MPLYFFDLKLDGRLYPDETGTELPDIYAVQHEAVRASGEMLRDMGGKFWDGSGWAMEVRDGKRRLLFTLHFSAEEHGTRQADEG